MISAPFSFGSQPQNRPHESSAHSPPRTVPKKLKNMAKQSHAIDHATRFLGLRRVQRSRERAAQDKEPESQLPGEERRRIAQP